MSRNRSASLVTHEAQDRVAVVVLNNPARGNALGAATIDALASTMEQLADQDLRAAVLTGRGECFCAGFDIREIDPDQPADQPLPDEQLERAIRALTGFPAPVVAALNGDAYGGGLDLVLACDLRVAHPDVRVAMTPCKLGIVYPAAGLLRFLVRLGPQTCRRLFLTAAAIEAAEAQRLGVIDEIVEREAVLEHASALAQRIAGNAPLAVQGTRRALQALESRLVVEPELAAELDRLKHESYTSRDLREGLLAFKERRKPEFEGR